MELIRDTEHFKVAISLAKKAQRGQNGKKKHKKKHCFQIRRQSLCPFFQVLGEIESVLDFSNVRVPYESNQRQL